MVDETDKQTGVGQNSLMTIEDYLILIHEDWKVILSDEQEKSNS